VTDANDYLPTIRRRLQEIDNHASRFGLCLYNAGMDPFGPGEKKGPGQLPNISAGRLAEREELVFQWCQRRGIPVAFVLTGGYVERYLTKDAQVNLHQLTLEAASRAAQSSSASQT